MDALYAAMLKVLRVKDQLDLLKADFSRFLESDAYDIRTKRDDETGEHVLFFDPGDLEPPLSWSVRVGEMLYDLRSALDHMVWQLVLHDGGTPAGHTEFPIFIDQVKYLKTSRGGGLYKLRGVGERGESFIRGLQPYHVGDSNKLHPLWVLHHLSIVDKHRFLHLASASFKAGKIRVTPTGSGRSGRFHLKDAVRIHGETEVARFVTYGGPDHKLSVEFNHTIEIAFDDAPLVTGRLVKEVFDMLITSVNRILVAANRDLFS